MTIRTFWWGILTLTFVGVGAAALWNLTSRTSVTQAEIGLPIYGVVPDFTLTDQSNRAVTRQSLIGQIWIADFIYTECGDQCPRLSQTMAKIQALLPKEANVELLSISVDPQHDTPAVLSQYAGRFHADPQHWRFLTGSPAVIHALAENFKLSPAHPDDRAFITNHSTRLIVVDKQSRIRGYYDGTNEVDVQRLIKDISRLSNAEIP